MPPKLETPSKLEPPPKPKFPRLEWPYPEYPFSLWRLSPVLTISTPAPDLWHTAHGQFVIAPLIKNKYSLDDAKKLIIVLGQLERGEDLELLELKVDRVDKELLELIGDWLDKLKWLELWTESTEVLTVPKKKKMEEDGKKKKKKKKADDGEEGEDSEGEEDEDEEDGDEKKKEEDDPWEEKDEGEEEDEAVSFDVEGFQGIIPESLQALNAKLSTGSAPGGPGATGKTAKKYKWPWHPSNHKQPQPEKDLNEWKPPPARLSGFPPPAPIDEPWRYPLKQPPAKVTQPNTAPYDPTPAILDFPHNLASYLVPLPDLEHLTLAVDTDTFAGDSGAPLERSLGRKKEIAGAVAMACPKLKLVRLGKGPGKKKNGGVGFEIVEQQWWDGQKWFDMKEVQWGKDEQDDSGG